MIVNVEFFVDVPMENVITSLNYRVDKTIFFGYESVMRERQACTKRFLEEICGVSQVEFCPVDETDLGRIIDTISEKIGQEIGQGNQVFFDLTGGESLVLVAFGILSNEYRAPMHLYEVRKNLIHEYGYEGVASLSQVADPDPIQIDLDSYIMLHGGRINYRMQKNFKHIWEPEEAKDIERMWRLSRKYSSKWVHYCALLRKFDPDEDLNVHVDVKRMQEVIRKSGVVGTAGSFLTFLDACREAGVLTQVYHQSGMLRYRYKNAHIKSIFWDSGSILELYVFLRESQKEEKNDCRIGVHIDWDGVFHARGDDVLNEIDIMSMENNLPIFISCKIGNMEPMALYELSTIAERFGGRYVKKVLAVTKEVSTAHRLRAEEMGIEIRKVE